MSHSNQKRNWERAIREALNEPLAEPRPGFARDIVKRVEERSTRPTWLSNRVLVGTAAALAAAVLAILTLRPQVSQPASAADQIRTLAREQRLLENELEDLQRLRQSAAPVVYLAGDESLEFVYALNDPRLTTEPGATGNGYRTADR